MKKYLIPILALVLCGLLVAAVLTLPGDKTPSGDAPAHTGSDVTSPVEPSTQETVGSDIPENVLSFPLELDSDRLLMDPPFTYDGLNPDCGYAEGQSIAAITVKNHSGQHLLHADVTLAAADGTELTFRIEHLPADRSVTAFSLDNAPLPADAAWIEARVSAEYAEHPSLRGNGVEIAENGMFIDVTNNTGAELTNLTIYCHDLLGEEYFGGKSYSYEINNLPAGETVTVEALDCVLGITEAAYTEGNER